jgi:hypothetical protein
VAWDLQPHACARATGRLSGTAAARRRGGVAAAARRLSSRCDGTIELSRRAIGDEDAVLLEGHLERVRRRQLLVGELLNAEQQQQLDRRALAEHELVARHHHQLERRVEQLNVHERALRLGCRELRERQAQSGLQLRRRDTATQPTPKQRRVRQLPHRATCAARRESRWGAT